MLKQEQCKLDSRFYQVSNSTNNHIHLLNDYNYHKPCLLLLGFDLNLVLQHEQVNLSVKKNNEHSEQYFCPNL